MFTINSVSSSAAASTSKTSSSSSSFSSKRVRLISNFERRRGEGFKVRAEPAKPKLKKAVRFTVVVVVSNYLDYSYVYLCIQEEFTAGGGGARGYCDVEEIKNAIKECEGTFWFKSRREKEEYAIFISFHHLTRSIRVTIISLFMRRLTTELLLTFLILIINRIGRQKVRSLLRAVRVRY